MAESAATPLSAPRLGPGGASHIRTACVSCHASKHRCERPSESSPCDRCQKTGRYCVSAVTGVTQVPTAAQITAPTRVYLPPARTTTYGQRNTQTSCAHCRKSKTRCLRESAAEVCIRCQKTGRDCFTNEVGTRGRRPKGFRSEAGQAGQAGSDSALTDMPLLLPTLAMAASMDTGFNQTPVLVDNAAKQFDLVPPPLQTAVPASNPQVDYLTQLGSLQQLIMADLELVKHCKAADKCPESTLPPELGYNASFPIGSMLQNAQKLLEILEVFKTLPLAPTPQSNGHGSYSPRSSTGKVHCDIPTMYALFACHVALVRIFRTNFSSIHDSMPFFFGMQRPLPQLFPGINLGGYSLESRLDLQVHLLIQVAEDMLAKLQAILGIGEGVTAGQQSIFRFDHSRILTSMLEWEADEMPPLHEPRGTCKPLKEILKDLKSIIQSEGARR